jgi:hypothetical protein
LPRREPYELNSDTGTPCSISHFPAGEVGAMLPAGEMWSVVIESPYMPRTRAPVIGRTPGGSIVIPVKYGGFCTYVDFASQAKRSPVGTSSERHCSFPSKTFAYCFSNMLPFTERAISSCTACGVGQMSRRKTGPSLPTPIGSRSKSMSMRPASA